MPKYLVAGTVAVALIVLSLPIAHTGRYWGDKTPTFFALETGDSYGEYAPLTRSTRDSAPFWKRAESVDGKAEVIQLKDLSNWQQYRVIANEDSVIRINTSYFIGWQAKIDGKIIPIDTRQNDESKKSEC